MEISKEWGGLLTNKSKELVIKTLIQIQDQVQIIQFLLFSMTLANYKKALTVGMDPLGLVQTVTINNLNTEK